ncbi:flippase [Dyadobacter chenwenxiniae]|uniref:Flippase n=1 Tax=Dyadobacter chenwenxiniae TaxID=2906456 RepID=A0A9X1TFI8_9BACT|nr:flippase [Dyadobacter chenwenxiniae]MCF0062679.1 flippase [Dyadobacter chenwenxiniae]UON83576.1 flippase [Dyadobacter chenwenxiniae]
MVQSVITQKSKQQLTKNVLSLTAVQIATYVMPLISVPVISRIIGPEKYGTINFAAALIMYFTLLISYSFDFSATRKLSKSPDDADLRNQVFSEVFFTQCLLFALSTAAFTVLLFTVEDFKANQTVLIFSYTLCISFLFTQNWLFQAMQDLSKVALFNLVSRLLFTVSIILVVRRNEDYIWQPLLIGMSQTIVGLFSFFWAIQRYKLKFIRIPLSRCMSVLWEEKTIFLSLIFVNLYSSTNTVILGLFQSQEQVGYYTAGQRLIIIAQSVLAMPLAQAFYPYIGKAFGEGRQQGLHVVQKLIPLIVVFIGAASVAMFVLGPFVITLFYGAKFNAAIPVFQILAIVPLLFSLNNVFGIQIMLNLGMDAEFFKISALAAVVSILLNLVLVKQWGYLGTTFNWLATELFILVSMCIVLARKGINPFNKEFFKLSSLSEYIQPLMKKFTQIKAS